MTLNIYQLGQPWPCLDLFPFLALLFGIVFHLQLVLLSYHPIFLRPYHLLKLASFLGANRTKNASVCLWMLRGAISILEYNKIQCNTTMLMRTSYERLKCVVLTRTTRLRNLFMLCYVVLCYVMLCYVMLCYVMLCYVMWSWGCKKPRRATFRPVFSRMMNFPSAELSEMAHGPLALLWKVVLLDISPFDMPDLRPPSAATHNYYLTNI